jgi:hypothetical protein
VLFAVANTPEDLRRNLAALADRSVLDLPEQKVEDEEVRVTAVLRWLRQVPGWLLIIDNVDTDKAAAEVETGSCNCKAATCSSPAGWRSGAHR